MWIRELAGLGAHHPCPESVQDWEQDSLTLTSLLIARKPCLRVKGIAAKGKQP